MISAHYFRLISLPVLVAVSACSLLADSDLTLGTALQRVTAQNPNLAAQRFDSEVAAGQMDQARLRPIPTLAFEMENFVGTDTRRGFNSLEATVQARQQIERGDKLAKRVALAEHEQSIAIDQLSVRRAQVLAQTTTLFLASLTAKRHLQFTTDVLRQLQETAAAIDLQVRSGVTSPAESAQTRAALAIASVKQSQGAARLRATQTQLASLWGQSISSSESPVGTLTLPSKLPDRDTLLAQLSHHPRLALQSSLIAGQRANLDLQHAQTTSDLTVSGGIKFFREGSDAAFVAGVSLPFPSRHTNRGNIRTARATLARAEITTRSIEVELTLAFDSAWQELAAAHDAALALRTDALPALLEAQDIMRSAYNQGQLPFTDVLKTQRAVANLQHEIFKHEANFASAIVKLDALTDLSFPLTQALLQSR